MTGGLPTDRIVAVIGAGTMGAGIALVAAMAGHPVRLHDVSAATLDRALAGLHRWLDGQVAREKLTADRREQILERIVTAGDVDALTGAGLVIEAIVENLDAKLSVLRAAAAVAPDAILTTNTSSLSVTALAAQLPDPTRVVGMHFFNPAQTLPLVEVVSGHATAPAVADIIAATARQWGKTPVRCGSTPGFIVNRVARPFYGEALRVVAEQAAMPATVDAVLRGAGGFRMGPFELMDLIGHDVNFAVTSSVYAATFNDPRYQPSNVQQALVEAGYLGRKSGRGFFDYADGAGRPEPDVEPDWQAPSELVVEGDLGPAAPLVPLCRAAGIIVREVTGPGRLRIDGIAAMLTDGRTSTARSSDEREPVVLFDLAGDFGSSPHIALSGPDGARHAVRPVAALFQALGKSVSVIGDTPGLIVARTVAMLANEGADAVLHGIADANDIDLAMVKGVNYPRGPLAWADGIGAAYIATVIDNLSAAYAEGRYRTSLLLRRHALSGHLFHENQKHDAS